MNTKQQPQISERVYREVVSRIEHGKVPLYPSLVRRKAIERYKAEKIAEIERAKRETERKIREAQRRREARRRREERRRYEEMKKALEASKKRVHAGHWVKIEEGGKSVSEMGIAAMSPSQAKALGYKWGTAKWNPKTGTYEFVPIPSAPSEPEYYGILKWKYESGHYKRPEVAEQIKKEIEIGAKKYGIVAPAWAGGYLKEYEQIARQIKESYLKAAESETKPSAIELKKALDSQSKVMQDLQRLQTQRAMLEKQIKATTHLAEEAKAKYGKYEKGGWAPEEIVKYGLLAGTVGGISKTLETQISEYNKQVQQLRESIKREQQRPVQPSVHVSTPKQPIVKQPIATKKSEIPVVYSPLMEEIKATGKVPTVQLKKQKPKQKGIGVYSLLLGYIPPEKLTSAKPTTKKPSISEFMFAPSQLHFGLVSKLAGKGEKIYEKKVVEPIEVSILGKEEKELREQAKKIERSYKEVGKHKKPEWKRTKEGGVVLPVEPSLKVKSWEKQWKPYIKGGEFTGTETQYQQYIKGFRKYYKEVKPNHYVLREQYLRLTPEAQRYEEALERYKKEVEKYKTMPQPSLIRQFVGGATSTIVGMPRFVAFGMPRIATETIAKPQIMPSKAISYAKGMIEMAKERPTQFAGSVTAIWALGGFKPSPVRPKISIAEFPKGKAISVGLEIKKLHGEAIFKPIISGAVPKVMKGFKPISIGAPKPKGEILSEAPYTPQTPLETLIARRYIETISPSEIGKIGWGIKAQEIIKGVKVKPHELSGVIKDVVEKRHKLPKGSGSVVVRELKKAKARVYGSVMQEAVGRQIGVKALLRTPRDIDVQVKNPAKFAKRIAEAINKKAGRNVVEVEGHSVIVKRTGEKLFDIHPTGFGETTSEGGILTREGGYLAYGFKTRKLTKTKEGIRTTILPEQALRKLSGAVELRAEPIKFGEVSGYIAPTHAGRVKDIGDYYFAGKVAAERLRMMGKYAKATELETRLEKWLESWGKDIAKQIRKEWKEANKKGKVKVEIGKFEGISTESIATRLSSPVVRESIFISSSIIPSASAFMKRTIPSYSLISQPSKYILPTSTDITKAPSSSRISNAFSRIIGSFPKQSKVSKQPPSKYFKFFELPSLPVMKSPEVTMPSITSVPSPEVSKLSSIPSIPSLYSEIPSPPSVSSVPSKPPSIVSIIPEYPFLRIPTEEKKKAKHKKHIKKSPYEWFEYHRIPTLKEMFGVVGLPRQKPKIKAKQSTELTSVINQLIGKPKL